jgi:hypothetical protein
MAENKTLAALIAVGAVAAPPLGNVVIYAEQPLGTPKPLYDHVLRDYLGRVKLTEDTTFYIRADGDDDNDGLTNDAGGAFETLQHALDLVPKLDFNDHVVTIKIVGDLTGQALLASLESQWISGHRDALVIEGVSGDKSAGDTINSLEISCHTPNRVTVQHLAIKGFLIGWEGTLIEPRDVHFLNATSGSFSGGCGIWMQDAGCRMACFGDWSIAEGSTYQFVEWWSETFVQWSVSSVTALGAGCNVSPFMYACGTVFVGTQTTFTGTFNGIRWKIDENGFINLGGRTGGLSFFPGTSDGVIRDAGRYAYGRNIVVSKLVTEDHTAKTITLNPEVVLVQCGRARVTTQFDKTNDTLADVSGLSVDVQSGRSYAFRAELYTTSDVAAGVKFAIGGSCSVSSIIYEAIIHDDGFAGQTRTTTKGNPVGARTDVLAGKVTITGTLVCSATGTLTVQFAQNETNAAASSVLVNSTLIADPVP